MTFSFLPFFVSSFFFFKKKILLEPFKKAVYKSIKIHGSGEGTLILLFCVDTDMHRQKPSH